MKKISFALFSVATFLFAFHSVSALTEYKYDGWQAGTGYGTVTKVDDNITNIKGNDTATNGQYVGPYSKASTAKLADGISEQIHLEIDPTQFAHGEIFELSLGLKNKTNEYVSEAVVATQKDGEVVKVFAGWAQDFEAIITTKGIYTYSWDMYIKEVGGVEKTFVKFSLLQGTREIAATEEVDLDTIVTPDTLNPVAEEEEVSVKYLWFCNVNVDKGVNVYTTLPVVKLTFVDPANDDFDLVHEVYQYAPLTEKEIEDFEEATSKAATESGYKFEGFYADEEFENELDFSKGFDKDVTAFVKMTKIVAEVLPPKTSDINLVLLISTIVVGIVGVVAVSKKRFAKSN